MDDPFLFHHLLVFQSHPILLHSIWRSEKNQIVNIPYLLKIPFVLHDFLKFFSMQNEVDELRYDFWPNSSLHSHPLEQINSESKFLGSSLAK